MFPVVKLCSTWSSQKSDLIVFSYLVAFIAYIFFNLTDVTVFDLRVNTIAWILLAAMNGFTSSIASK